MIDKQGLNLAIDDAYDVSALIQVSMTSIDTLEGSLKPYQNRLLGDIRRVLEIADKKAVVTLEALEGVDMHGYMKS